MSWSARISTARDFLDLVFKIVVVLLPFQGIVLFFYLNGIGRPDLFWPTLSSAAGFFSLIQTALVLAGLVLFCLATPSIIAAQLSSSYINGQKMPMQASLLMIAPGFGASVVYGIHSVFRAYDYSINLSSYWSTGAACLMLLVAFGVVYASPSWFPILTVDEKKSKKARLWWSLLRVGIAGVAAIYSLIAVLGATLFAKIIGVIDGPNIVVTIFTMLACSLPGALYLVGISRGQTVARSVAAAVFFGAAILMPVFFVARSALLAFAFFTLTTVGVVDREQRDFAVYDSSKRAMLKKLGFEAEDVFVKGFVRFQFGDIKLLCVDAFDPTKTGVADMFLNRRGESALSELPKTACAVLGKDEIRVVQLPK